MNATPTPTDPDPAAPPEKRGLAALIVKATGVLLVVPALINAAYDVYAAALKLPRTDAEKVNTELFKKYFNKQPLAVMPLPVKNHIGTVDARFAIYEEGEIYVEFGKFSQWFPFPKTEQTAVAGFSLIPSAFAQTPQRPPLPTQRTIASQQESIAAGVLLRSRVYSDGTTETRRIDIRSGSTLSVNFGKIASDRVPPANTTPMTMRIEPVDLASLRKQLDNK